MKSSIAIATLVGLLALGAACNKPNPSSADTSAPPAAGNSAAAETNAANPSSAPAESSQRAVAVTITVPAGKVLTVRLANEVGSKISQSGQTFGGSLAKPVEVDGEVVIPAGARVEGEVVDAKPLGRFKGGAL